MHPLIKEMLSVPLFLCRFFCGFSECFIFLPSILFLAECRVGKAGVENIYIKGVFVRFGFDVLELRNFTIICQKQSSGDALWGVYTLHPDISHISMLWELFGCVGYIYHRGVSALLVSTDRVIRRPQHVKRVTD